MKSSFESHGTGLADAGIDRRDDDADLLAPGSMPSNRTRVEYTRARSPRGRNNLFSSPGDDAHAQGTPIYN